MRFVILKKNGLVFQSQVAYLIPIFGVILGFLFLDELITSKVLIALVAVILGIYFVKKSSTSKSFWEIDYLKDDRALMCEGFILQQPPKIVAPFFFNLFEKSQNNSGLFHLDNPLYLLDLFLFHQILLY